MAVITKPAMAQDGFSLIEVLVALVVFAIASAAVLSTVSALYSSNARNNARIVDQSVAHDLSALISGNPSIIPSINGVNFTKGQSAPSAVAPLSGWWSTTQGQNPFIQSVDMTTTPAACVAHTACLVSVTITSKPPFSSAPIQRTYEIQEGF